MSRHESESTDEQWAHIVPLLPELKALPEGAPKPISNRPVVEGILRIGARWKDLPGSYPSPNTAGAPYDCGTGCLWLKAWRRLKQLDEQGQLDRAGTFADSSFAPAKKGGAVSERPNVERFRNGLWRSTAYVFLWETTWSRRSRPKSR